MGVGRRGSYTRPVSEPLFDHDLPPALALVPVKSFRAAKGRLAGALDEAARAGLARAMAEVVLAAAHPLGVAVVCDDDDVAAWAREHGAAVVWTPGLGLNGALAAAIDRVAGAGVRRVVIAHADLPFARDLARFAAAPPDTVLLVADRRGDGTNVMSLPTGTGIGLHYGPGSFTAHRAAATAAGLTVEVVHDEALGWDVDEPGDLHPPAHLGPLPELPEGVQP